MKQPRNRLLAHLTILVSIPCLADQLFAAGRPGIGVAQPTNHVSPSGAYSLSVDPADRYGNGAAYYRCCKNGVEVWSGTRPYTLCEVVVTDGGLAAGFAYRRGPEREEEKDQPRLIGGSQNPPEFLHIVILGPDGGEILNDETERIHPPYLSNPPSPLFPYVEQFLVDPANDRLITRVVARGARWWVFRLSTGERLGRFDPKERMEDTTNLSYVIDAQPVAGTSLLLTHWYVKGPEYVVKDEGGRFTLFDAEFKPVWSLDAPNDYVGLDLYKYAGMGGGPSDCFEKQPAILPTSEAGRFRIRLFAESKEATFFVRRDRSGGYRIDELGRIDVPAEGEAIPSSEETPSPPLTYLGELELGAGDAGDSPFRGLRDFTFDRNGQLYFYTQAADYSATIHRADAAGKITDSRPFEIGTIAWEATAQSANGRFLVSRSKKRVESRGYDNSSTWVDLATGEETPTGPEISSYVPGLGWFPDGGFVVLDRESSSFTPRVTRFEADGTIRWRLIGGLPEHSDSLGNFQNGVAVLANGRIALLDSPAVRILSGDGAFIRKIDLSGVFGNEEFGGRPSYLGEVIADNDGGFLVADSGTPPVVLRYNADGSLRSRWSPRHPDGKTFDLRPGIRVAPDGRLWTSDGNVVMRLTDDGVVDLVLGPQPDPHRLGKIAALTVDRQGDIYVVAFGSGVIHVFGRDGSTKRIVHPDPADVPGTVRESFIAVNGKGEVYLKKPPTKVYLPADEYLRYSPHGERLESITFEPSIPVASVWGSGWAFQPKTDYRCGICPMRGDTRLVMVDPPDTLIRDIRKRPNGKWFSDRTHFAMAPDGSMAVLNQELTGGAGVYELDLFTAEGSPIRTVGLPPSGERYSEMAFDGRRVVVAGRRAVILVDTADDRMDVRTLNGKEPERGIWSAFIMPDSDELLLFDGRGSKLQRYELPPLRDRAAANPAPERAEGETTPDATNAAIRSDWVNNYMRIVQTLTSHEPCVIYTQTIESGHRYMTEAQVLKLPEEERRALHAMNAGECGMNFDAPRVYARLLDILAANGIEGVQGWRVLDFGCCDLRHLQALARLGADVVGVLVDYSLTAMCNNWDDVGVLKGPDGQAGHLDVVRAHQLHSESGDRDLGADYNLITFRNTLQALAEENYFAPDPWKETYLASTQEEFVKRVYDALAPGGYLLSYSVGIAPSVAECGVDMSIWQSAGFEVLEFNRDDRGAALGIGLELGWQHQAAPLDANVRAMYSLLRKPGGP